jgi:hypothetical protein
MKVMPKGLRFIIKIRIKFIKIVKRDAVYKTYNCCFFLRGERERDMHTKSIYLFKQLNLHNF